MTRHKRVGFSVQKPDPLRGVGRYHIGIRIITNRLPRLAACIRDVPPLFGESGLRRQAICVVSISGFTHFTTYFSAFCNTSRCKNHYPGKTNSSQLPKRLSMKKRNLSTKRNVKSICPVCPSSRSFHLALEAYLRSFGRKEPLYLALPHPSPDTRLQPTTDSCYYS